jgi:formate-dependent nitrite reductase membrane component NrfD
LLHEKETLGDSAFMRKMAIIISLVSFVCLGAGLIIRLLSKPEDLLSPTLPWRLTSFFLIAGNLILLVAMLFYILYQYRQEKTKERQFKQWGMVLLANKDLLRSKREEQRVPKETKDDKTLICSYI